jgi:hypothetical protein
MATSTAVPAKNLSEWHTPSTRTEVINELINGVGGFASPDQKYGDLDWHVDCFVRPI